MTPLHFDALELAIQTAIKESGKSISDFRSAYQDAGLSEKRLRWDILWSVPADVRKNLFTDFYHYLDDTHIDTALRKIVTN